MVNNFEDDGRVFNEGGVAVLGTRGVGGGSIFDSGGGNVSVGGGSNDGGTDGISGGWGTGTSGSRLVFFSCSHLVWVLENTFRGLSFPCQHLHSIKSDLFLHLLVKHMLEGLDDSFIIIISVVGVGRDCSA
jgi:hypothetical protein